MPRPDLSSKSTGGKKSRNPFSAWAERRKEAKYAAAEEAARTITNDTAKNETAIVDVLGSIDFLHSPLPKQVLESKSDPNQPCGDLEYASRALQRLIIKSPQVLKVDIRQLDEKLLTLALLFKQAVEQGDERAAYAARAALVRGLNNIRNRIPQSQPELSRLFVEANAKYLESWITLVGLAQVADRLKQNNERQRALYEDEKSKSEASITALEELLQENPEMRAAFKKIMESDTLEERAKWDDKQREVHVMMIERRMGAVKLNMKDFMLTQNERELTTKVAQVDTLYAKVAQLPIIADPNLLNKYREQIDQLFEELAASDVEIDETLKLMDDIDGRIEQLNNAPGAVRAREVAAEEAERALEEIRRRQEIRSGEMAVKEGASLRELGIHSKEELEILKQQNEAEEQRLMEEALEELGIDQSEAEVLYN